MVNHHITLGRMNPPTIGHENVVKQVMSGAKKDDAGHTIFLTHSHDSKKNPLTPEQKLKHAKRAFPGANIKLSSKESPTILHHASNLHKSGVTHLTVHVGSDRVEEFHKLLHSYNGKKTNHGYYKFKKITVKSVGEKRKDTGDGVASASGSAMRKYVSSGNKVGFNKMAPSTMSSSHKNEMYNDLKKNMNESFIRFKDFQI